VRILLVEDEHDIAEPLADMLRSQRYDVTWAPNAVCARRSMAEREFDMAVLDVMLPEGEDAGFRLAEWLRDAEFLGGILFLTARDSVADRISGLDLGGDDYLVKPFSFQELLARIRALSRRTAQTRSAVLRRGVSRWTSADAPYPGKATPGV
jgi:DNA-binding response OmpR family regulator